MTSAAAAADLGYEDAPGKTNGDEPGHSKGVVSEVSIESSNRKRRGRWSVTLGWLGRLGLAWLLSFFCSHVPSSM